MTRSHAARCGFLIYRENYGGRNAGRTGRNDQNRETEQRRLRPYQLVLDDGVCYLFGFDELRNAERIFSLVRMRNVIVTENVFELPEDYEFERHCKDGNFGA